MSQFFNSTVTRIQPLRQEGVVDTIRDWNIVGYTYETNAPAANAATLTVTAAATVTGAATVTVTVNPAYQPFSGQNVRTITVNLVAGDTVNVVATKIRAALAADFLLSAYFTVNVSGAVVTLVAKQIYEPLAFLSTVVYAPGTTASAVTVAVSAAPLTLPSGVLGRLVYTPSTAASPQLVRTIEAGATGVIRGIAAWCPDVEYDDLTKREVLRPLYMHDVCDRGIINMDGVTPSTTYASAQAGTLFVYITGTNAGRIRVGADAGAVALTAANFPNLLNLGSCIFTVFEPSIGSSPIYKLSVEIN